MIDPGIAIHDVERGGYLPLVAVLGERDLSPVDELHVILERGRVRSAVHTSHGPCRLPFDRVSDRAAAAARLRRAYDVQRVVIVDGDSMAGLGAAEAGLAIPGGTQFDLILGLRQAFWEHPGVFADPPPAPSGWPRLLARLRSLPDGWVVLAADDGARVVVSLLARLDGSRLVEITSVPEELRPLLGDPEAFAAACPSPVSLLMRVSWERLRATLLAPDLAVALLSLVEDASA